MSGLFKVTVTDHSYHTFVYTAYVAAASRHQALIKGAALAGGCKTHDEWKRTGREPFHESLINPSATVEPVGADEFYLYGVDTVQLSEA